MGDTLLQQNAKVNFESNGHGVRREWGNLH
jgi:hypothetical protein